MKTLLPFLFSTFIPGTGQLYLRKYLSGIILLLLPILVIVIFPKIPLEYPYLIFVIISVADVYFISSKSIGRKKALLNLSFALIIALVILPATFYLFILSMYKGGEYIKNEHLNIGHTKREMVEISNALTRHYARNNEYPEDYFKFVTRKPIWEPWSNDSWDNNYKYELTDGGYKLTSAGVDGIFDTEDDITRTN
jgi:TM2 domain-containing membrane protein YozV